MFGMLTSLAKAAVGVVVTPVAAVVDTVRLPIDAADHRKGAYENTGKALDDTVRNLMDAIDPKKC